MSIKVCDIQTFSLHNGPGIRTTIFLAGCPLRCAWCHNPETHKSAPVLIFDAKKCIGCGECAVCPWGVHDFHDSHSVRFDLCRACGACVDACPSGALSLSVSELGRERLLELVAAQTRVFGDRGGLTFSGGEPLMQGEKLLELLAGVDIHLAVETSGYASEEIFRALTDRMDLVMMDIKLADELEHVKYTGVSNEIILKNLEYLRSSGKEHIIRTPLIPGITDTEKNLEAIEKIVGSSPWERLPYNPLTPSKYERLGLDYSLTGIGENKK